MNLDPFDEHTDEDLWRAMEHAHLKDKFDLMHECSEDGGNMR